MDLNSIRDTRCSGRFVLRFKWCCLVLCLGCGSAADQNKPVAKVSAVQPESDSQVNQHISLQSLLGRSGNVHIHYLTDRPASKDDPFFVIWSDADLYAGSCSYPSPQNNPPRTSLVVGDYR